MIGHVWVVLQGNDVESSAMCRRCERPDTQWDQPCIDGEIGTDAGIRALEVLAKMTVGEVLETLHTYMKRYEQPEADMARLADKVSAQIDKRNRMVRTR